MDLWIYNEAAPPADKRLSYGPNELHYADLRMPHGEGPHPLCIVIHGGFWRDRYDLEHLGHLCTDLTRRGIATWSLEYRRIGQEGGGWPGTLEDVALATDYVRYLAEEYNLDLERVVTTGHSAGGHLALWLAARPRLDHQDPLFKPDPLPLRAAISLAGVSNLEQAFKLNLSKGAVRELMGGSPAEYPERYAGASPFALLPLGVRQILIHGTADVNVPFEISRDYTAKAVESGDPVTLVSLPDAGHFELVDPHSSEWSTVVNSLLMELAPNSTLL